VNKARSDGEWGIQMRYKLEAETFQEGRKFSRVWFGPDHTTKSQTIENIVSVDHNKKETCQQHTAYIKVLIAINFYPSFVYTMILS